MLVPPELIPSQLTHPLFQVDRQDIQSRKHVSRNEIIHFNERTVHERIILVEMHSDKKYSVYPEDRPLKRLVHRIVKNQL